MYLFLLNCTLFFLDCNGQQNLNCIYFRSRGTGYISPYAVGLRHLKPHCWIIDGMCCSLVPRGASSSLRPTAITYWEAPEHGSLMGQMDPSHHWYTFLLLKRPGQTTQTVLGWKEKRNLGLFAAWERVLLLVVKRERRSIFKAFLQLLEIHISYFIWPCGLKKKKLNSHTLVVYLICPS